MSSESQVANRKLKLAESIILSSIVVAIFIPKNPARLENTAPTTNVTAVCQLMKRARRAPRLTVLGKKQYERLLLATLKDYTPNRAEYQKKNYYENRVENENTRKNEMVNLAFRFFRLIAPEPLDRLRCGNYRLRDKFRCLLADYFFDIVDLRLADITRRHIRIRIPRPVHSLLRHCHAPCEQRKSEKKYYQPHMSILA